MQHSSKSIAAARGGPAVARAFAAPRSWADRAGDCLALTKPRVTLLVVLTAVASCYVAAQHALSAELLLFLALGTGLLAGGTAALNQLWERRTDALMARTRARPLPAGHLQPPPAALFGGVLAVAGTATLAIGLNWLCAEVGLATTAIYLLAYTPMKFRSPLSTVVGALPGAGPILMGWAAARGTLGLGAWILFGIQFLWQFPHFLSIAWLYKEQYERAGIRMLPVVDENGAETSRQVLLYSIALIPVSLLPSLIGLSGPAYFVGALGLGAAMLGASIESVRAKTRASYLRLLRASVLYLPLLFALMAWDRVFHP
ncbi:MAG TPA: heme o synthase [Terriglobales bacterium]|nr:heme o synthase [Terriglobales bacterium]